MTKGTASILDVKAYLKHFGATHIGLGVRGPNPQWGEFEEVSASWYARQPINLDDGRGVFTVPDGVVGAQPDFLGVFDTPERGTGELLMAFSAMSDRGPVQGGTELIVVFSKVLVLDS